ncbi:MAG: DUF3108 domain-containing protein [Deltaproteobacteria bacterium]|nr:DUF3108 domain-containing protein [Deltaproteobacteria bacterium]
MAYLTRRDFFRWILGFSFLPVFPFYVRETGANSHSASRGERRSIAEFFKGEELSYEIGFWLFKRAALGTLSFKAMEKKGRYMAILQAETLGVLGFVVRYRVDTYRSVMEEIDGGRRLRVVSFEEDVKVGDRLRRRSHLFDYQKMRWIQMKRKKDGAIVKTEEEIPSGKTYDDFLTASYNFRYGVYGEIERGKRYSITTFPRKGSSAYELSVVSRGEEERRRRSEKLKDGKEYYVKLALDPEITHSKEGLIEGWLSKELYPTEGLIRDVVLFGDVTGRLIHKVRNH